MSTNPLRRERLARTWRERARIFGPAALLSLVALIVTYHFVQPAPPRHIIFATGQEGGAYFLFGLRYQALLARRHRRHCAPYFRLYREYSSAEERRGGCRLCSGRHWRKRRCAGITLPCESLLRAHLDLCPKAQRHRETSRSQRTTRWN